LLKKARTYLLLAAANPNWIRQSPRSAAMPQQFKANVSNLADLDHVYATVEARAGRIDVLAVNAGVYEFATLGEITEEQFDRTFWRSGANGTMLSSVLLPLAFS
jgi:NAD(P)-dependent dehydrogenase (short-subunit alcohol dehydrogenase family)